MAGRYRLLLVPVDPARLRELPLFSELAEAELAHLAAYAELKTSDPGDVFTHEGASGYTFFVILKGTVDVDRDGELIETLGPGDFFGEMAILGSGRRNATVTASTRVELLVLFGTVFRTMESEHPDVAERIKRKVAERRLSTPDADLA
jgi:CRP-like cAMP-binding protein